MHINTCMYMSICKYVSVARFFRPVDDDSSLIPRGSRAGASSMSELTSLVIQRRIATRFFSSLFRGISSSCVDDHIDRSSVVSAMTWHFMIALCITLFRNETEDLRLRGLLQCLVYIR